MVVPTSDKEAIAWCRLHGAVVEFRDGKHDGLPFFRKPWVWISIHNWNPSSGRTFLSATRKLARRCL